MKFGVDKGALGEFSLRVLKLSLVSIIPPTSILIYMLLLPEGHTDEAWEPSKSSGLSEIGEQWIRNNY
jgi:hypothetical protein